MKYFYLLLFTLSNGFIFGQQYEYSARFGHFSGAVSFSYNSSGCFYVSDSETNEIFKIDTLGNVLKYTGGYGWDQGAFDNPAGVFATPLNLYAADRNNHRIEIFDKDLNFLSVIKTRDDAQQDEAVFGFPLGCVVSSFGDIFVLDSENKKIVKFNSAGQYTLRFGDYTSGSFALNNPKAIALSAENNIYVLDDSVLCVFDQFGAGLNKFRLENNINNINITFGTLILNSVDRLYIVKPDQARAQITSVILGGFEFNTDISAGMMLENSLFVLTKKEILVFKIKKG
ncbi:MAG: NHL repeat-containing protein [Methanococcaceae archaeon]